MSAGGTLFWAGVALVGVALVAPSLNRVDPPQSETAPSVAPAPAVRTAVAGNGFASQELTRAGDGHFYVDAQVNGARIRFLIDTGASVVALTPADAQRAGIALPSERRSAETAGGTVEVIPVSIERLAIGPIEARDVRGAVADALPVSLLGQSFLSQVATVEISGDRMTLR